MEDIKEFLRSIGIGKNEAEIYVALVRDGPLSILEISKLTKIHRPNVYDSIEKLMKTGIVWEARSEERKMFFARPPNSLVEYLKQKEMELNELVKGLVIKSSRYEESKVSISKGKFALKQAITGLLEHKKTIFVFGIPPFAPEIIGPILRDFHKERIKKRIVMKHIYNSDAAQRAKLLNKMQYTEARCLPSKYNAAATTNIVEGKVVLIVWGKEITIIEIKDNEVANSYRAYFDILWSKSKVV